MSRFIRYPFITGGDKRVQLPRGNLTSQQDACYRHACNAWAWPINRVRDASPFTNHPATLTCIATTHSSPWESCPVCCGIYRATPGCALELTGPETCMPALLCSCSAALVSLPPAGAVLLVGSSFNVTFIPRMNDPLPLLPASELTASWVLSAQLPPGMPCTQHSVRLAACPVSSALYTFLLRLCSANSFVSSVFRILLLLQANVYH